MATPNFKKPSTSKYFCFGFNKFYESEDVRENGLSEDMIGEYDEVLTEMDYQDAITNVVCELKSKGWDAADGGDNNRYYYGAYIATKNIRVKYAGMDIEIRVNAKAVSGYYEAATFDFDIDEIEICTPQGEYVATYDFECIDESMIVKHNWLGNVGFSKIHAKRLCAKIQSSVEDAVEEMEKVFAEYCEQIMVCGGIFSNGEAIYYPADSLKGRLIS